MSRLVDLNFLHRQDQPIGCVLLDTSVKRMSLITLITGETQYIAGVKIET